MAWGLQALQDQLQRSEQAHQATVQDLEAQIEQGERRLRAATAEAQAGIERELLVEVRVREALAAAEAKHAKAMGEAARRAEAATRVLQQQLAGKERELEEQAAQMAGLMTEFRASHQAQCTPTPLPCSSLRLSLTPAVAGWVEALLLQSEHSISPKPSPERPHRPTTLDADDANPFLDDGEVCACLSPWFPRMTAHCNLIVVKGENPDFNLLHLLEEADAMVQVSFNQPSPSQHVAQHMRCSRPALTARRCAQALAVSYSGSTASG